MEKPEPADLPFWGLIPVSLNFLKNHAKFLVRERDAHGGAQGAEAAERGEAEEEGQAELVTALFV